MSEITCTLKILNIADDLYAREIRAGFNCATRSPTNITTSVDRPHPVVCAVSTDAFDSGLFAVPGRPMRLSSQFAATARAASPTDERVSLHW